ncbi:MAG: TonB-dependent receptor [Parvularculaceae bacterium]|nr:TonB-dependent receptor [Parvularculaceae bacterium]
MILTLLLSSAAATGVAADEADTIVVYGRGLSLIGEVEAASEGVVGYADFEDRTLSRVGELVEVIPGVVATQHSGEGKANQYFLRGFNLDHGTDFSVHVDGVPVNLRTHGHGQGYLDLNFVIPEVVERVDFRKGPYRPDNGDFSAAGAARYRTYDQLDEGFVELTAGEFGFLRAVSAASSEVAGGHLLLALEGQVYDGPWQLEQDLQKLNGFAKWTRDSDRGHFHVIANAYNSEWTSTDQVPERAIDSGRIGRFGFIDDDLGGETSRYSLAVNGAYDHADGSITSVSGYAVSYDFRLFSNFTYFLEDPVNGDEFEQRDRRRILGGDVTHIRPFTDRLSLRAGAELRYDDITDLGLFRTAARQRLSTVRSDEVQEFSFAGWAELQAELTPRLRANVGLRSSYYTADVNALSLQENSGEADDQLLTPTGSLAFRASDSLEVYASYGQGFHSNDVRGATISIDPVSGDAVDQVPILVKAEGGEIGLRFEQGAVKATLALFTLNLDSELVFVGDAGATEPNDGTTRQGVEATMFWTPLDWLVLDASAAYTDAEFDVPGDEVRIPGAVETVLSAGAVARFDPLTLSARLRHFGEAPLIEDGSVTSDPTTIVNLGAEYELGPMTLGVDVLNLFDSQDADITYLFESQLPGEVSAREDIHFHPVEPRQLRINLRRRF